MDGIYSRKYGTNQERFKFSLFLLFLQTGVNCIFAFLGYLITRFTGKDTGAGISFSTFVNFSVPGFSQVLAGFFGNKAQEFIDVIAKTLIKSMKPVSVLVVSFTYSFIKKEKINFHFLRILGVVFLSVGISLFTLDMEPHGASQGEKAAGFFGIALSLGALFMDGVVGSTQDRIESKEKSSTFVFMLIINIWGLVFSILPLLVFGEHLRAIDFIIRFPELQMDLVLYCLASPIANYFIFLMIAEFGALQCSIITTSRKFLTILVNSLGYSRSFSPVQIYSIIGVFVGVVLEQYGSVVDKRKEKSTG